MASVTTSSATLERTAPAERRWLVLVVVAVAQLMLVLDATIVNIALPSAQQVLGFSESDRQWVVTAYALSFGSLLLVGGRLGDMFSRKWVFVTGLVGFALASAIGGAAGSFAILFNARCVRHLLLGDPAIRRSVRRLLRWMPRRRIAHPERANDLVGEIRLRVQ